MMLSVINKMAYKMEFEVSQQLRMLLDIVIATLLCGIVGYERESMKKPAGLRTNMIVGGAACLIVSLTLPLVDYIENYNTSQIINTDPIRVLEALVVGISFIGAGTIIKQGDDQIKGLTTAATLLYSLGIGISVALRQYVIAAGITIIILIVNMVIRQIELRFSHKKK